MAHFAEIDENNVVIRVLVVDNEHENRGEEYLSIDCGLGGKWVQTSYNTFLGKHKNGKTQFRKNYAGPGMIYDEERDAFYTPQPYPSWVLNEEICNWEAPVPLPTPHVEHYAWNEEIGEWNLVIPLPVDEITEPGIVRKAQIATGE